MTITRFMYTLHRVLGTLLSALFLVWFLSAFVMMYHGFPQVTTTEKQAKQQVLTCALPALDEVAHRLPPDEKVRSVRVDRYLGQTIFHIRTAEGEYHLPADSADTLPIIDAARIYQVATLWCQAPVERIDTLSRLDQWIPFGHLRKEFPIYQFHFDDPEQHQLYIGSLSGEVLQYTSRDERFWAWLGAIPHWVYFTWLRQDAQLWSITLITLSAIGCLMTLAGLWVGVHTWRRSRKGKAQFSPYRKRWYHWHYVTGIVFGLTVFTFTFSGLMSLADIPAWVSKPVLEKNPTRELKKGFALDKYKLDYRQLSTHYPDIRSVEWSNFRSTPYYVVKRATETLYIDASDSLPRPLKLAETQVVKAIRAIHGDSSTLHTTLLTEFETDYRDMSRMRRGQSQLPVWKVVVDDADHSSYYIHPQTGTVKYVNTTSRWKYWTYTALHRLRVQGLNSSATLRKSVLWVLLLGGTVVSLSGLVLGLRYIRRKLILARNRWRFRH